MRDKARQRMADLRKARKNRTEALAFDRRFGLADGAKGRITNLREVFHAIAQATKD